MACRRTAWRTIAVGIALIATGSSDAASQTFADPEVVGITFEGNEAFPDGDLENAILTAATRCRTFLFVFPLPLCPLTNWGVAHIREYLDGGELPLDVLRLRLYYRQRGFRAAMVDTTIVREEDRVRIRFNVVEGEPTRIRNLGVSGGERLLDSAMVNADLSLVVGDPLDLVALGEGERRLAERLRKDGYVHAQVLREYFIPTETLEADVNLRVEPGPRVRVGDVRIVGSGEVGDAVIQELLRFQPGDWFREDQIVESQRSLYSLQALRWANIASERRSDTDTLIDLRVEVAPAPKRSLQAGLGLQTDECVQGQASLIYRNFLGDARILRFTGRVSNLFASQLQGQFPCTDVSPNEVYQELNYLLEVGFEQPVFSDGRNNLRASVFGERETVPDLYVRNAVGGQVSFSRRLQRRMQLTLGYQPALTSFAEESADIYFCVNFGVCDPEDIQVLTEANWLSPITGLWTYDRTDNPFAATRGWYVAVELEQAGDLTFSDYQYSRGTVDGALFRQVSETIVLGGHVRTGVILPYTGNLFEGTVTSDVVVHPQKRFFAGGPQSVRGFGLNLLGPTVLVLDEADCEEFTSFEECAQDVPPTQFNERPLGGNSVFEGSVEARFRAGNRWTVAAFVDFGQVWETIEDRAALVATPGAGVRFRSPVGPLRLDVGYNPTGTKLKQAVIVLDDGSIEEVSQPVSYDPFTWDDPSALTELWRRLRIQFSIGEAF
jgi:outer membrane protein assembly complex protein YaeT